MDFGSLIGPSLTRVGPWGLLILVVSIVVYLLLKGVLVAGSAVDRMERQWEARLKESADAKNDWKDAFMSSTERLDTLAEQIDKLMITGETTKRFIQSLPRGPET